MWVGGDPIRMRPVLDVGHGQPYEGVCVHEVPRSAAAAHHWPPAIAPFDACAPTCFGASPASRARTCWSASKL